MTMRLHGVWILTGEDGDHSEVFTNEFDVRVFLVKQPGVEWSKIEKTEKPDGLTIEYVCNGATWYAKFHSEYEVELAEPKSDQSYVNKIGLIEMIKDAIERTKGDLKGWTYDFLAISDSDRQWGDWTVEHLSVVHRWFTEVRLNCERVTKE